MLSTSLQGEKGGAVSWGISNTFKYYFAINYIQMAWPEVNLYQPSRWSVAATRSLGFGKAILIGHSGKASDLYCYLDLYPVEAFLSGTWTPVPPRPPTALRYFLWWFVKTGWNKLDWETHYEIVSLWLLRQRPSSIHFALHTVVSNMPKAHGCSCFTSKQHIAWLKIKRQEAQCQQGQGRPVGSWCECCCSGCVSSVASTLFQDSQNSTFHKQQIDWEIRCFA